MGGAESTPSAPDVSPPDVSGGSSFTPSFSAPPPPPPSDYSVSTAGGNLGHSHSSAPTTGPNNVAGSVTVTHAPLDSTVTTDVSVGGGMNTMTGGSTLGVGTSVSTVTDAGNTVGVHANVNTDGTGSLGFSTTF